MKVLGISGRGPDAAAAVAVNGRIVAAVSEHSQRSATRRALSPDGIPAAATQACLDAAGLRLTDLDAVAHVSEAGVVATLEDDLHGLEDLPSHSVDALHADALQAAASSAHSGAVLVCSSRPAALAPFEQQDGTLVPVQPLAGADEIFRAAASIAHALGLPAGDPYAELETLTNSAEPDFLDGFAKAMIWNGRGVVVHQDRLSDLLTSLGDTLPLNDAASINVRAQHARKAVATSFTCRLADLFCDAARSVREQARGQQLVLAGGLFSSARLSSEIRDRAGSDIAMAALPELQGRAIGAALVASCAHAMPLPHLALGPAFSNADVKRVLDNCRLDYVYEPDWSRILTRVSTMLQQGKVVAWFQGPLSFGPRSLGTRSVLCDPSNRYARHNINEFYRQVSIDEPLPLVFAPAAARMAGAGDARFPVFDIAVDAAWRGKLVSAVDTRQRVRVHTLAPDQAPELQSLLDFHYERTGVPGLIETNLSTPGEPAACTPREAIRTTYASAIDALIIGNFVLMKDHWLLRSDVR